MDNPLDNPPQTNNPELLQWLLVFPKLKADA